MASLLILGGTAEARALAAALVPGHTVVTSLAGRTGKPEAIAGSVRTGGFGGADGLTAYLRGTRPDALIDATHPFARRISANARAACDATGTPRLILTRPAWTLPARARAVRAATLADAAATLPGLARRAFLTVGRDSLDAFAAVQGVWFLVRMLDAPTAPLALADYAVMTGRPPFTEEAERALFIEHAIDTLVAKDAGGGATEGKILAAAGLGVTIVLIERPAREPGDTVETVAEAEDWIRQTLSA